MYIEKIKKLIYAITSSNSPYQNDDLKFISTFYESCASYIQAVMSTESMRMALKFTYDNPLDYHIFFESKDNTRSNYHNVAMANIRMINKVCQVYECEPIFTESELNFERVEMADRIIKPIVIELFDARVR